MSSPNFSKSQILRLLIRYGHLKLKESTVDRLSLDLPVVQDAIYSYRQYVGPTTLDINSLFAIPRCGQPDFGVQASRTSWKKGCDARFPNNHSVVYRVDKTRMPLFLRDTFEAAWDLMRQAYAEIGLVIIRDDTTSNYNSLVTFEKGRGWIGLAIVGNNHTCRTKIWAKFDTVYKPSDLLNQWARLLSHEVGHNCGLSHSRGGIMNASILPGVFTKDAWKNDPLFNSLKIWFGGLPVTQIPIWNIPGNVNE
jgi:hypothetical protein